MISFDLARDVPDDVDLVVEGVTIGSEPDDPVVRATGFKAKVGSTVWLPGRLLVGLGENGSNGPDERTLRKAAGAAARAAAECERIATTLPAKQAVAEGFSPRRVPLHEVPLGPEVEPHPIGDRGRRRRTARPRGPRAGARIAEAVGVARDLVNEPGGSLTPPAFADAIRALAKQSGLDVRVLTENAITKAGYNGLLAVNRGRRVRRGGWS